MPQPMPLTTTDPIQAMAELSAGPAANAPLAFTTVFLVFVVLSYAVRWWLAARQIRHVRAHRDAVPGQFAASITLDAHHKAADYTVAKVRLGMIDAMLSAAVLLGFTVLGGLDLINRALVSVLGAGFWAQIALVVAVLVILLVVRPLVTRGQIIHELPNFSDALRWQGLLLVQQTLLDGRVHGRCSAGEW
mgnify:CR=1 FL=1